MTVADVSTELLVPLLRRWWNGLVPVGDYSLRTETREVLDG